MGKQFKDIHERTLAILESFHKHGVPGNKIDYLCVRDVSDYFRLNNRVCRYVDETQDNLLVDALCKCLFFPSEFLINEFIVLRSLCQDPNSLFWAGDTAQTISVGSSFRFN